MCKLPTESLKSPLSHQRDGRAGVESRGPASSGPRAEPQAGLAGSDLGFTADVPDNGYRWWYLDAFSPDHRFGLTIIAFIGSVFSPYYAWAGRADPENHLCLNVCLYGPKARWAMTERPKWTGARDADMIIAATYSDEVNMVTCQVAHSVFSIPRKIARLRSKSYLTAIYSDLYRRDHMPIDVVISPEREVAEAAMRRLSAPAAFDVQDFLDGRLVIRNGVVSANPAVGPAYVDASTVPAKSIPGICGYLRTSPPPGPMHSPSL